jgi:predicted XRE-type DNA-binding protein
MQINKIDSEIKTILNQYIKSQNISTQQFAEFVGVPKNKIDVLMNKSFNQFQDKVYLKIYVQKILDKILINQEQKKDLLNQLDEYCQSEILKESEKYEEGIVQPIERDLNSESDKFQDVNPLYFQTQQYEKENSDNITDDETKKMEYENSNILTDKTEDEFTYTQRMNNIDSQTQKISQENDSPRRTKKNTEEKPNTGGKAWGRIIVILVIVFLMAAGLQQLLFRNNSGSKEKIGVEQTTPTPAPTENKPAEEVKPPSTQELQYTKTFTQDSSFNGIAISNEPLPLKMEVKADKDMSFSYRFTFQQGTPLTETKIKKGETKTFDFNSKNIFIVTENGDTSEYKVNGKNFKLPGKGKGVNEEQWIQVTVK